MRGKALSGEREGGKRGWERDVDSWKEKELEIGKEKEGEKQRGRGRERERERVERKLD